MWRAFSTQLCDLEQVPKSRGLSPVSRSGWRRCSLRFTWAHETKLKVGFQGLAQSAQAVITKYYKLGGLNNKHFSQFWRLGSSRSKCQQIQCLGRALFLICRQPPSCCVLPWQRGLWSLLLVRALIHHGGSTHMNSSKPNYPPTTNTITLVIRASHHEFGGVGTHTFSPQQG